MWNRAERAGYTPIWVTESINPECQYASPPNGQDERLAVHLEVQLIRIARGRPVRSIQLLYQSLLRKPLKSKREPLFERQHGYPHNVISQGTVIAGVPLTQITYNGGIFVPSAVLLKEKWVEHKYGSITMVEAFCQELIRVRSKDSAIGEVIWNTSVEKGNIIRP